jgi:hypothetical protein
VYFGGSWVAPYSSPLPRSGRGAAFVCDVN